MAVKARQRLAPAVVAEQSVAVLKISPGVVAICLVGSVARGDARPDSDVDLFVITRRPSRELRSILREHTRAEIVSLICKTPTEVRQLATQGSLFLAHARTEGRVVHDPDGILADSFAAAARVPLDTEGEIQRRLAGLEHYRDLDRFGGNYLFALAHLYGISKGLAMARCAQLGRTTFVKADALAGLAELRPGLRPDIEFIQSLRPFYDLTRGHQVPAFPFAYVGANQETHRAVEAATRLARDNG